MARSLVGQLGVRPRKIGRSRCDVSIYIRVSHFVFPGKQSHLINPLRQGQQRANVPRALMTVFIKAISAITQFKDQHSRESNLIDSGKITAAPRPNKTLIRTTVSGGVGRGDLMSLRCHWSDSSVVLRTGNAADDFLDDRHRILPLRGPCIRFIFHIHLHLKNPHTASASNCRISTRSRPAITEALITPVSSSLRKSFLWIP